MSKEELDKLFKNKLQDHQQEPAGDAWERLTEAMEGEKKKRPFMWWRVAAAVLLLAAAGWFLWPQNAMQPQLADLQSDPDTSVAADTPKAPVNDQETMQDLSSDDDNPAQALAGTENKEAPAESSAEKETMPIASSEPQLAQNDTQASPAMPEVIPADTETNVAVKLPDVTDEISHRNPDETMKEAVASAAGNQDSRSPLVISIEEFDEALIPDESDSSVVNEQSKKGLKKLWAAVRNAPSALENGLNEIRDAKNELLTLDKDSE